MTPVHGLLTVLCLVASVAANGRSSQADGWRPFAGSWSATGQRQSIATETGRDAVVIHLSGAIVLTSGNGLSRGFRGVAIGFEDGLSEAVGRSVWTDERGDRIFGTFRGESVATGKRFTGTITGGTGRYASITGSYSLGWQYVVEAEDGRIQGRTVGFEGRFRLAGER